jgi:hypothetical protein
VLSEMEVEHASLAPAEIEDRRGIESGTLPRFVLDFHFSTAHSFLRFGLHLLIHNRPFFSELLLSLGVERSSLSGPKIHADEYRPRHLPAATPARRGDCRVTEIGRLLTNSRPRLR